MKRVTEAFGWWILLLAACVIPIGTCLAVGGQTNGVVTGLKKAGTGTDPIGSDENQTDPGADHEFSGLLRLKLTDLGIHPSRAGIKKYLAGYLPDSQKREQVKRLIKQLGSDNFQERSRATAQLASVGLSELPLVQAAVENPDLEISLRAKQVLEMFNQGAHLVLLRKVLHLIATDKIKGLSKDLCLVIDSLQPNESLLRTFEKALEASAVESDHALFRKRLANPSVLGRRIFVRLLSRTPRPKRKSDSQLAAELIQLAQSDDSPQIRLAAATELAFHLDRRCLPLLIEWLESETAADRFQAVRVLRSVTGVKHDFFAAANAKSRDQAIQRWKEWYVENGETATLFKEGDTSSRIFLNRLVVSSYTRKTVVETDLQGKVIRRLSGVGTPMGVFGSPDGRILVCDYSGRMLRIYDAEGKQVFTKKLPGAPLAAEILENGNILTGTTDAKKVLELDPSGKVVWEAAVSGRINVVHRTTAGTTLVSMLGAGKVLELDAAGKIIFELELKKPNGVRRLENGNTLVCMYDSGEVREYDPNKNVVWKIEGLNRPARAQRMPDGNTVIYCRGGIRIVDPAGELVRQISVDGNKVPGVGSLHYF